MKFKFSEFGMYRFDEHTMRKHLPSPIFEKWKNTIEKKGVLDRPTADAIAHAMKEWAISLGCTHYTHWFQPMTGSTAEKHDAFLEPDDNDLPIQHFSGKALIKGEPDASSFPSGGLRATFEARGYTYWDCSSPAFIKNCVLCIPTVFVSYNGESLDKKAPLLRSIDALDKSATRMVNILGDKQVHRVRPVIGLEQEYFLIDLDDYNQRLDLKLTGRTLFGRQAPKSQELEDHYFGAIPTRVQTFMDEVNQHLWHLGIYAKTEHNEVAPNQFEIAPIFNDCNVAIDQNQVIMSVLKSVAKKHNMACLLHEKPFKGINGSGKHNNYSLVCDDGQNLFAPGDKPIENIRFLVFLSSLIKAVDEYSELLRMAASSGGAGNDYRLGANEAPPAIVSIYLGNFLENTLDSLLNENKTINTDSSNHYTVPPVNTLAYIPRDNTDRNRTSPMAFTGNKFEFRMLGSSMSASVVNTVLNTALAKELDEFADQLEGLKYIDDIRSKALQICKETISKHQRILFSGDGYSQQWIEEAARRGLPNIASGVESFQYLVDEKAKKLFTTYNIYSEKELDSRCDILYGQYEKTMEIESRTALHMITRHFLPNMVETFSEYAKAAEHTHVKVPAYVTKRCDELSSWIDQLNETSEALRIQLKQVMDCSSNSKESALLAHDTLVPALAKVREIVDEYEKNSSKKHYGLPTYDDILFRFH